MQTNLHQIRIVQITSPPQSGLGPKALQTTQNWQLWPKVQHFCMILSLPFASNPWIFGGFESPVQLKGVCSIFVALDSSLPLGKRNNAASRAQKKRPLMAENRVSPHHPQQNIDRNDWFVVGVVTPPQLSILYRC